MLLRHSVVEISQHRIVPMVLSRLLGDQMVELDEPVESDDSLERVDEMERVVLVVLDEQQVRSMLEV